jgi:precorrin-6B methylase 2
MVEKSMAVPIQEKLETLLNLVKNPDELSALLSLKHSGYLDYWGWFNAFNSRSSVGKNNEPLPWVTYPFIEFIRQRLKPEHVVFEFGSGNSTIFYSRYVKSITAVEHSREWYDKISSQAPANAEIIFNAEEDDYPGSIKKTEKSYDIIIVDAVKRVECIEASVNMLNEGGIIVLDDSDREEYSAGKEFLKNNGFNSIEFWGISPGYFNNKCTTVFYKKNNCLGI